ncbi:prepilin-type cleavage/methylation domain-containing protein [Uliginosibacterium aquaticum]|uniref:Prepilin-type cleavage/methylation domain-containing protein n=1 Tax=Uliginosibacterium aquaticum TaxID=2731212 RepID=A0ABX2IIG9_9RHOO|nr:prepilin-type cleavage/methylation domain-containing protein [Uliginosibacterium aquaticum]NSL56629.1 prepilin-type cleavage/methylation domain-containing protein [Uliginosibacterium aquaticum]
MTSARSAAGFSLAEMAITLLIITLLSAGALLTLRIQTEHGRFAQTQAALLEAKQALLAYAAAQGALPCPADPAQMGGASFGAARSTCSGDLRRGLLPWRTLGVQGLDAWDQYLSYEVSNNFTVTPGKTSVGNITVVLDSNDPATDAVAFALWSHGANGNGAISVQNTLRSTPTDTNEISNRSAGFSTPLRVVLRTQSDSFDDQGLYVSRYVVLKQLMDAGFSLSDSTSSSASSAANSSASP